MFYCRTHNNIHPNALHFISTSSKHANSDQKFFKDSVTGGIYFYGPKS